MVGHGTHDFVNGGAGRAAKRIVDATLESGVDSRMISSPKAKNLPQRLERRLSRWQGSVPGNFKSAGLVPGSSSHELELRALNIVHLHWIGNGFLSVPQVGQVRKPIVWTMHDMWPFTGNEHYASLDADALWRKDSDRSKRRIRPEFWNSWALRRKQRHWGTNISFVAPSNWMASLKRDSSLLRDSPVTVIPNPVPLDLFQPRSKDEARQLLGIPISGPLIGFVADEGSINPLKGFAELARALEGIRSQVPDVHLLCVGKVNTDLQRLPVPTLSTGQLRDDERLALAYAACDVICVPSIIDNAPQTIAEASASGRPVVGFNSGGVPEMISDNETGLVVPLGDEKGLGKALTLILTSEILAERLGCQGRERACSLWSPEKVGLQYRTVYEQLIRSEFDNSF